MKAILTKTSASMPDLMNALVSFQKKFKNLQTEKCELSDDYIVYPDKPEGVIRLCYAKVVNGKVQAVAIFASVERLNGKPCFNIGYAVDPKHRGNGLAVEAVNVGIKEMKHGFGRNGHGDFYVEAVIDVDNLPSIKVAEVLFSTVGKSIVDKPTGKQALSFQMLIKIK